MASRSLSCPRCGGSMEQGFIVDEGYGKKLVSAWIAGEPQKSFWAGLRVSARERVEVATYRCRQCGYLESYA
jgi:predicted nucleic-acid-binding Zn-ribbon protein